MNFRIFRGDICLASFRFPHEDEIQTKHRPVHFVHRRLRLTVLVIQNDMDDENANYPLVIVAPITTQKVERIYEQDVFIAKGEGNLEEDSKVLLGALQAVAKKALVKRLGSVHSETMEKINLKLLRLLGFFIILGRGLASYLRLVLIRDNEKDILLPPCCRCARDILKQRTTPFYSPILLKD